MDGGGTAIRHSIIKVGLASLQLVTQDLVNFPLQMQGVSYCYLLSELPRFSLSKAARPLIFFFNASAT